MLLLLVIPLTSWRSENMHKVQQSHSNGDAQRIRSSIFGLMSSCFDEIFKIYRSIKIGLDPFKKKSTNEINF